MKKLFNIKEMDSTKFYNRHLKENDMGYFQHLFFALMLSLRLSGCAIASIIHAFIPFVFVTHTSQTIYELNEIFALRRKNLSSRSALRNKSTLRKHENTPEKKAVSDVGIVSYQIHTDITAKR